MTSTDSASSVQEARTTSDATVLRLTSWLRVNCAMLEAGVLCTLAGSAIALGAVHPWAYVPLWGCALVLALMTAARTLLVRALRQRLGPGVVVRPPSGRWVSVGPRHEGRAGWHLDLRRALRRSAPLLIPGLVMMGLVLLQLTPLPAAWRLLLLPDHPLRDGVAPLSVSPNDTWRGLAFLATALCVHAAAAAALARRPARERLARGLALLVVFLGISALLQTAHGTRRIYGVITSVEGGIPFGPFVNRNHFATWMVMATCVVLGTTEVSWRRYRDGLGGSPAIRRWLVALQGPAGIALLHSLTIASVGVAVTVATGSRAGIVALGGALVIVAWRARLSGGVPAWALAVVLLAIGMMGYRAERLLDRFVMTSSDASGRLGIWSLAVSRVDGVVNAGSGFNTFGAHVSRVSPWRLPVGAVAWPATFDQEGRPGYLVPETEPGQAWFREAHSDWLQLLLEAGLPGLLVAVWAATAVIRSAREEPWRLAALMAALMHALVDFSLQVPAVMILFVTLAASGASATRRRPAHRPRIASA